MASWFDASSTGTVPHMRQVAPPSSTGRHFSFLSSPQDPVEWKPFKVCVEEGSFVNLLAPSLLPCIRAHTAAAGRLGEVVSPQAAFSCAPPSLSIGPQFQVGARMGCRTLDLSKSAGEDGISLKDRHFC